MSTNIESKLRRAVAKIVLVLVVLGVAEVWLARTGAIQEFVHAFNYPVIAGPLILDTYNPGQCGLLTFLVASMILLPPVITLRWPSWVISAFGILLWLFLGVLGNGIGC